MEIFMKCDAAEMICKNKSSLNLQFKKEIKSILIVPEMKTCKSTVICIADSTCRHHISNVLTKDAGIQTMSLSCIPVYISLG
jgi:hypothetical protein